MSCLVCLLPFHHSPHSLYPNPPPPGILTDAQKAFFRNGFCVSPKLPGVIDDVEYLDANMFGQPKRGGMIMWEGTDGCFFVAHRTCFHLLQVALGCEDVSEVDSIVTLCEIERVLGRPSLSSKDGIARLPFVNYEQACGVDMRSYWTRNRMQGQITFDWLRFKQQGPMWLLARPDTFPKFYDVVSSTRLDSVGTPLESNVVITTLPMDVLRALLPYLEIPAFLSLTSSCRFFRKLALKEFQPHARRLVLSLPWTTPLLSVSGKSEHKSPLMVHSVNSPQDGDWLLYLSHAHRTKAMKERRRIWEICQEIRRAFDARMLGSEYGKRCDKNRKALRESCLKMLSYGSELYMMNASDRRQNARR